jgi:hypothetical protein
VGRHRFARFDAIADRCASFNFTAQASQQTSTDSPPMVTWTALASSAQSQAAHVLSGMARVCRAGRAAGYRII